MNEEMIPAVSKEFEPVELYKKYKTLDLSKLKAVYALNMCTVSVSQILDYNDTYILEQEYDTILNNLNLEVMPKDEALRNILTELLNVITFFRIQEAKKDQIDKKYQRRVRDAIWSAIPNFSVLMSSMSVGNIGKEALKAVSNANIAIAAANIVTQVGTGYMNYRREKANAGRDKENDEFELQITAIEQFNALQRELFTTAWKLAAEHKYPDELRLTERQIKQYNQILMDPDDYRKCARLESIWDKFLAYPPFWYMLAHTALSIVQTDPDKSVRNDYRQKAKDCFGWYYNTFCFASDKENGRKNFGLLREDHIAATALLEYASLLRSEENPNGDTIYELIKAAENQAGQANDILQLCAVGYLDINKTPDAERLLKVLVNEGYNTVSNARLLSWLYAYDLKSGRSFAASDYELLRRSVCSDCLFPLPSAGKDIDKSNKEYIGAFKKKLIVAYRLALTEFESSMAKKFSIVPQYPSLSDEALADCHNRLKNDSIALEALKALNQTVCALDMLTVFMQMEKKTEIISYCVASKLENRKATLDKLKGKDNLNQDGYKVLKENFSYKALADSLFVSAKKNIMEAVQKTDDEQVLQQLTAYEDDLVEFCRRNHLESPAYLLLQKDDMIGGNQPKHYFDNALLGISSGRQKIRDAITKKIKDSGNEVIYNSEKTEIYMSDENNFVTYFENKKLKGEKFAAKAKAIAIIDDKTRKDYDLLLCDDGIMVVHKNKIESDTVRYDSVDYQSENGKPSLTLYYPVKYQNDNVNIEQLYNLIKNISAIISAAN